MSFLASMLTLSSKDSPFINHIPFLVRIILVSGSIVPLFPLLPPGFELPPLISDFLETLLSLPITISIPHVLSATAIVGF